MICVVCCCGLAELGDYREAENPPSYLSEFCFISNQPQGFEKEVAKHHQQHRLVTFSQSVASCVGVWVCGRVYVDL